MFKLIVSVTRMKYTGVHVLLSYRDSFVWFRIWTNMCPEYERFLVRRRKNFKWDRREMLYPFSRLLRHAGITLDLFCPRIHRGMINLQILNYTDKLFTRNKQDIRYWKKKKKCKMSPVLSTKFYFISLDCLFDTCWVRLQLETDSVDWLFKLICLLSQSVARS